ncbi:hypothetical protein VM1G_10506 [Cytospora mali]|uniref:ATP-dependent RNA helicase n=1 Tax=Cytospora mali TaxID=578113 RepID=A0A194VIC9_CYTMA|nr:hypothetical protein VM1G_10506 [Valsa mali]
MNTTAPGNAATMSRFEDLKEYNIHPTLLQTITKDMKFEFMTPVQAATLPATLSGADVLAQAKTGTGKTLAFLLPVINNLVTKKKPGSRGTSLLVISPTRELAMQIATEATTLLQRFPGYKVCTAIGGTNPRAEAKRILAGCDILIATPGRLQDHLTQEDGTIRANMQRLQALVLDECDRLLDMGFLKDLKRIVALLAEKAITRRQGMLFSATIAPHVAEFASLVCSKGYKFISTIPKGEAQTHDRVPQQKIIVPEFSDVAAGLIGTLRSELNRVGPASFKAIVFAPTAAIVDFYADIMEHFQDLPKVRTLHSRMTQSKRSKLTDEYRQAKSGILVATDVVARGMDFPGVTNVIQAGVPMDRESYIHRLGRTARAGANGRGTIILTKAEQGFPATVLKGIDLLEAPADLKVRDAVFIAAKQLGADRHKKVYQAWLGYYKDQVKHTKWNAEALVEQAEKYAINGLGAPAAPLLDKKTIGKMGLKKAGLLSI